MLEENSIGQTRVKQPRQNVAKEPMAEAALAAKELKKARELRRAGRIREPTLFIGHLREEEKWRSQEAPWWAGRIGEPVPIEGDLGEGENQRSQR